MEEKQQKVLNTLLKFKERDLFCTDCNKENNESYSIVADIISLLVAGARPTDYNIYGQVWRIAEEMEGANMSPFFHAKNSINTYVMSILDGSSKVIQENLYKVMLGEVQL
jgi:hypothetical protein